MNNDIDIEELVDSFTEDEFGAVTAVINWLNDDNLAGTYIRELNAVLFARAERELDGTKTEIRNQAI